MEDLGAVGGGESMGKVCPLDVVEARLDHKYKALKKHADIVRCLKEEIIIIETEKRFIYSCLMKGRRY